MKSRLHKFRVFHNGKMYYPEKDNCYLKFFGGEGRIPWGLYDLDDDRRLVTGDPNAIFNTPGILMQYTGEEDKNGMVIFEGDIFLHPHESTPCVVEYQQCAFGIKGEGISQFLCYAAQSGEVIGNIYENPDKKP